MEQNLNLNVNPYKFINKVKSIKVINRKLIMRSNKILITGSSGLFGSNLIKCLEAKNYNVIGTSLKSKSSYKCDLTKYLETKKMILQIEPDFIINLVAMTNVDDCEKNSHKAYELNVTTIKNIVQSLENKKIKYL